MKELEPIGAFIKKMNSTSVEPYQQYSTSKLFAVKSKIKTDLNKIRDELRAAKKISKFSTDTINLRIQYQKYEVLSDMCDSLLISAGSIDPDRDEQIEMFLSTLTEF